MRRLAAEAGQAAVHRQEHVLTGILALGVTHAQRSQKAEDQRGIALVQRAPGRSVTGATTRDQLVIGDPGGGSETAQAWRIHMKLGVADRISARGAVTSSKNQPGIESKCRICRRCMENDVT